MTGADILAALQAAESGADVLAALARGIDAEADAPSPEALAEWWAECPDAARTKATERLQALARFAEPDAPAVLIDGCAFMAFKGWDGPEPAQLWASWPVAGGLRQGRTEWIQSVLPGLHLSRLWLAAREKGFEGRHPLAPIVGAWIEWPEAAGTVDGPEAAGLFPAPAILRSAMRRGKGRRNAWKRFSLPAHTRPKNPQLVLPGLAPDRPDIRTPDIPLDVADGLGLVGTRKGALTPEAKMFFAALMAAELADRQGNRFLRRPVEWWFRWLHPDPPRAKTGRLWRDLRNAIDRINDLPRVCFEYSDGGREAIRLVSFPHGPPPKPNDSRDRLSILVSFAPGANRYAVEVPWARALVHGVSWRSGRRAALLLRLAMRWAEPNHGRLRVRDRRKWIADRNPANYRPIGEAVARALIAPRGATHRTPSVAAEDLAALAGAGDVLLYDADGRPIKWRGETNKIGAPVPGGPMVRKVRAAMRAGALKVLPAAR